MSVINFPTFEERRRAQCRKDYAGSVDIFPEPIRTEILNDLVSYGDRLYVPTSMQLNVPEGLTDSQIAAITAGFNAFTAEVLENMMTLVSELIDLRFKKAACQILHCNDQDGNPAA